MSLPFRSGVQTVTVSISPDSTACRSSSTVSDWPSAMLSSHRAVLDAPWKWTVL